MNKHSPFVLIKKKMLKIWNFPMKQTKNPNTQFEIQIGKKGKSWKTNLWIVAHGGSGLFPSSGELFFFEIVLLRRSVWRWWRFGVKEVFCEREGSYERSCESASRLFFFFEVYCFFKLRLRRSGYNGGGGSAWRKQRNGVRAFGVFMFSGLRAFGCLERDYCWELFFFWRGVVWLAGVKHWFYASSGPNVFSF